MEASHHSINYLSDQEYKIYVWTDSLTNGTRSGEGLPFKKEDIKLDYNAIYKEYSRIQKSSTDNEIKLEALKRLIFLNWESMVEPEGLTGIRDLDEKEIKSSYEVLNNYIKLALMDDELRWMLGYYSCWDWIILNYSENLPELSQFVNSANASKTGFPQNQLAKGYMDHRGQMGIFWKSIVERTA